MDKQDPRSKIPTVTRHRASLLPSVAPSTNHLFKKLETKKKRCQKMNLSRSLKLRKLEKQISIEMKKYQSHFESEIFAS